MAHPDNPPPRLYIASLSDYNTGILHGVWIDATDEPDDIQAAIQQMLASSPSDPHSEEVAIHDYEGFGPLRVGEYDSIRPLCRVAQGIAEHGIAFAHWADVLDRADWDDRLDQFPDTYRGHWTSLAAYAEDYLDDERLAPWGQVPDWIAQFVSLDWAALGEYLATDLLTSEGGDGVYLFEA